MKRKNDSIFIKARAEFLKSMKKAKNDKFRLGFHVFEVDRWARYLLKKHKDADPEITLLGVWLHDLGQYQGLSKRVNETEDHAVTSEKVAKIFLEKNNYPKEKMAKVLHCVRAHRCKDVLPQTKEAKIVACCDSASHFTEGVYIRMIMAFEKENRNSERDNVLGKLERDYRDLKMFPEVQKKLEPLYHAWKALLEQYLKVDY